MKHAPTWTRRDVLKTGLSAAAALPFISLATDPAPKLPTHRRGQAKAVIEIWLWGGASHIDTFDPKPASGRDICGTLCGAIESNVSGIRLNNALPLLAKQAKKYSLVRGLSHGVNAHETATYMMQTGRMPGGGLVYPSIGAVITRMLASEREKSGVIPPYIALTSTKGRFSDEGFLGPEYKPFATGGNPAQTPFLVEGVVAKGISDQRQERRRELLVSCDGFRQALSGHPGMAQAIACEEKAYEMMNGEAREVFDLSNEGEVIRERYGMNQLGQACLLARRLVERGVKYVSINARGWDTHKSHFIEMNRMLPELDRGVSNLLDDLSTSGLLDSTLVWCSGEFGRTPRILWKDPWKGGRGHFGNAFSALVAGGGFRGGEVVGETDARGETVTDRGVSPQDFIGSIYELVGIDPDGKLPNPMGRDLTILPKSDGDGRLYEIM